MKKSVVLFVLLAGLVAFAVFYQNNRDQRMNSARLVGVPMREYLFPELPVAEIRKIRIRGGDEQVNLEVDGERWVVKERNGYAAAFEKISKEVEAISQVKINGKNEVGPSALAELMLLPPAENVDPNTTGLQVELMNASGDTLASFVAGDSTRTTGGANSGNWMGGVEQRYVSTTKDANTVWMINDIVQSLTPDPKQWLSKAFIDVAGVQGIGVKSADPAKTWTVGRVDENGAFSLEGAAAGQALDETVTAGFGSVLTNPVFSDVHPAEKAAELLKDAMGATLITFDGFVYDVRIAPKKAEEGAEGADTVYFSFVVKNDIPDARPTVEGEKEEDKKMKDEAFAAAVKATREKLAKEKAFEGWVFELPKASVEVLLKSRAELIASKPAGEGQGQGPMGQPGLPSSGPLAFPPPQR
ncbi:DUF4340 domain-containing protein [Phragmitibacter flavus]|uniref:DUF4340 domain-containing protein n=1 Tax=Phragmitibacter flavus TaxID=2576071 RepID=A0A5R8KEM9_9BACT|nr:DUF4340 domain-containing protein [Phragmitibacter flavus]TLD70766.1 DUF4340 domain-containing protein [Phragmitibacter flavus]